MAYNYEYPYTDVYRHNDDWALKNIAKLDSEYSKLVAEFEQIEKDFQALSEKVDNFELEIDEAVRKAILEYRAEIDAELKNLREIIEQYYNYLNDLKKYIDDNDHETLFACARMINECKEEIYAIIDELAQKISEFNNTMYNPLSGEEDTIERVIVDLWESERYGALSNAEYEALEMDNDTYDSYNLKDRMYAVDGRKYLTDNGIRDFLRVDGMKTIEYNCNSYIFNEMLNSIDNNSYVALDYDNDTYAALDITNMQYLIGTP